MEFSVFDLFWPNHFTCLWGTEDTTPTDQNQNLPQSQVRSKRQPSAVNSLTSWLPWLRSPVMTSGSKRLNRSLNSWRETDCTYTHRSTSLRATRFARYAQ